MFCFQCQETVKNEGCTKRGVCGKEETTANLQDLLIYNAKGICLFAEQLPAEYSNSIQQIGRYLIEAIFSTITNANFNTNDMLRYIQKGITLKEELKNRVQNAATPINHPAALWFPKSKEDIIGTMGTGSVLSTEEPNIRSLRELLTYGIKGICAYAHHAKVLGFEKESIYQFIIEGLAETTKSLTQEQLVELVLKAGSTAVDTMALLDEANTKTYGNPEITEVNLQVGSNPGILVSGHDLKDFEELLEQTNGTGVDIYTHSEMLPANSYPRFKKYNHLVGNYGSAWHNQKKEFEAFNGPILMTTNCLVPPSENYKDRLYTTGVVGFEGIPHIPEPEDGKPKDFSRIIEQAKRCDPPTALETGSLTAGFAHNQVRMLSDKVVDAIKSGAIKRFVVMAGCDGRQPIRKYFTEVAEQLPPDTIILTAGCAKYRYNKLQLGDIQGIPRVLDAGQCNDSFSLVQIALLLKEKFGLENVNDLPLSFDIAWYEQKAVAVLLALLASGFKGIRVGPTLPAFLSEDVASVLISEFGLKVISNPPQDVQSIMEGA